MFPPVQFFDRIRELKRNCKSARARDETLKHMLDWDIETSSFIPRESAILNGGDMT